MIRRETERQNSPKVQEQAKEQEGVDENGDPIPTGEFEYKMWCNRRNAEGLPILPRPVAGAPAPKRPVASTAAQIPVGKLEEIK